MPFPKNIFTKDGKAYQEGDLFIQDDLANTLERIRNDGTNGFYEGKTAELIVNQINSDGGYITLEDLANYKPIERSSISTDYKGYKIITMGPPSGGGVTLLQMLNILENFTFKKEEWGSSEYIHKLVMAMKYSFADRSKHIGDPDFYNVPLNWLLSKEYAKEIAIKLLGLR